MSDFNIIHVNNKGCYVYIWPYRHKKYEYTVMKADSGFPLFLRTLWINGCLERAGTLHALPD